MLNLKIKFLLFRYKWYAVIFLISGIFAYLIDKPLELILYFICYCSLRYEFPKTFHHDNFYHCIFWSTFMMIMSVLVVTDINLSVFGTVATAYAVGLILYYVRTFQDLWAYKLSMKTEFTNDTLNEYFTKFKTPDKYKEYLIEVLINGMRDVDYFNNEENRYRDIDEQQYRNYKYKFLKKIKKNG